MPSLDLFDWLFVFGSLLAFVSVSLPWFSSVPGTNTTLGTSKSWTYQTFVLQRHFNIWHYMYSWRKEKSSKCTDKCLCQTLVSEFIAWAVFQHPDTQPTKSANSPAVSHSPSCNHLVTSRLPVSHSLKLACLKPVLILLINYSRCRCPTRKGTCLQCLPSQKILLSALSPSLPPEGVGTSPCTFGVGGGGVGECTVLCYELTFLYPKPGFQVFPAKNILMYIS